MITEDYISFEVAKLLKEKGFDINCYCHYSSDGRIQHWNYQTPSDGIPCPTIQMVLKWLRELYGLMIVVHPSYPIDGIKYESLIYRLTELKDASVDEYNYNDKEYDNYEQACESAIKYCIENLI